MLLSTDVFASSSIEVLFLKFFLISENFIILLSVKYGHIDFPFTSLNSPMFSIMWSFSIFISFFAFLLSLYPLSTACMHMGIGPFTEAWETYQWPHAQNKIIFPSHRKCSQQLLSKGSWELLLYAGISATLIMYRSWAENHGWCEFMITIAMPCPARSLSQHPSLPWTPCILSASSSTMFTKSW